MANELVCVKDGLDQFLTDWADKANSEVYRIGLYKNSSALDFTSDLADITEADFGGYGGKQDLDSWDTGGIAFSTPRYAVTHPTITFTADGSTTNTIYGYFVTNNAETVLLWFQPRAAGVVIGSAAGQPYVVNPKFTDRSEF